MGWERHETGAGTPEYANRGFCCEESARGAMGVVRKGHQEGALAALGEGEGKHLAVAPVNSSQHHKGLSEPSPGVMNCMAGVAAVLLAQVTAIPVPITPLDPQGFVCFSSVSSTTHSEAQELLAAHRAAPATDWSLQTWLLFTFAVCISHP